MQGVNEIFLNQLNMVRSKWAGRGPRQLLVGHDRKCVWTRHRLPPPQSARAQATRRQRLAISDARAVTQPFSALVSSTAYCMR